MIIIIILVLVILITLLHYFYGGKCLIENFDMNEDDVNNTYQSYNDLKDDPKNGPMFLAMKNAANIAALHSQLAALKNIPSEIIDISGMVHQNSNALVNIGKEIHKVGAKRFNTDPTSNTTTDPTSNTSTKINSTITGKNITSNTSNNSKYNFPTTSW